MANDKYPVNFKKSVSGYNGTSIEVDVDNNYEVYTKDTLPEDGQYTVDGKTLNIDWFVNFGIRLKPNKTQMTNFVYTVKLKKLPDNKRLFVRNESNIIIEVEKKGSGDAANAKLRYSEPDNNEDITFSWDVEDPPIGMGP